MTQSLLSSRQENKSLGLLVLSIEHWDKRGTSSTPGESQWLLEGYVQCP